MSNRLLACTAVAASLLACHKSTPETGPAPAPAAAADTAAGAVGNAPTAPSAAVADSALAASKGVPGAAAGSLSDMLTKSLPVSADQAKGGVGAILAYAQGKLAPTDYQKVEAAVPEAAEDLQAAKAAGAVSGPITERSGLDAAFGKLGISPEVAAQFVPAVTNYIGKAGGPEVAQLVQGLF